MKLKKTMMLIFVWSILITPNLFAESWKMKRAPIMTEWSEDIDTLTIWPEYPRPQMVRNEWMNLNGVWDFEKGDGFGSYNLKQRFSKRILIPFPIESALSGIMDANSEENKKKTFFYRTFFTLPERYQGKNILLHFGAVDWECAVFVNGIQIGMHRGGYDPFSFNITSALKKEGEQEIQVHVNDPSDGGGQPKGKQAAHPGGIYYTSVSGIWQTVWLEPVEDTYIDDFTITPDVDSSAVIVNVGVVNVSKDTELAIKIMDGEKTVSIIENVEIGKNRHIKIPDPNLWSPDSPFLYRIQFELKEKNQVLDQIESYFGMRKVSRGLVNGTPCLMLNDEPVFHFGLLDQGYWPDGLYTPPSDEAMLFDLQKAKELGVNMMRKHVKVEPARWYYHCDTMGIMVWQDMPNGNDSGTIGKKSFTQHNFYLEMINVMKALKNSPSIVTWVVFNEGWGQDGSVIDTHTRKAVSIARETDTTRLINAVSGWVDYEVGDMIDRHNYPAPALFVDPLNERVSVCGEYGGITLKIDNHLWKGNGHEYVSVDDSEKLKNLFIDYLKGIQGLQQPGIWGAVYTQMTDVEEEINGLITYDRKVVKLNNEQIAEVREIVRTTIESRTIPLFEAGDVSEKSCWKYNTANPGSDWNKKSFDDISWPEGIAGFGAGSPPNAFIRTPWDTGEIYLRRTFNLNNMSQENISDIKVWVYYDEDFELYINGVLAAKATGYVTNYRLIDISDAAQKVIDINGENLVAVKCRQTWGGQYIDVGLAMVRNVSDLVAVEIPPQPEEPIRIEQDSVYLMSYFKGSPQNLYYAYSEDGLVWDYINYGEPVFAAYDESIWLRDPYMKRVTHKGEMKFHLVHTWGWDNPAIFHWESTDLINWKAANGETTNEDGRIYVMDGKKGNAVSHNAWAPEFTYDPATETFYIFWSSSIDGKYQIHHYCTTQDWLAFTPSAPYFDPGFTAIDLTVMEYDGVYYGFYKDERGGQKRIRLAISKSLDPAVDTFKGTKEVLSPGYSVEVEGPEIFKAIGQNKWFLYWDKFINDSGISYASTTDPVSEKWRMVPDSLVKNPSQVKHGSVEIISREELEVLLKHFDKERLNILPTAEIEPQEWRYTTQMPWPGWYKMDFDDSTWESGLSGFGRGDVGNGLIATPWETSEIYLRKKFYVGSLTDSEIENLFLKICHDDDVTVYINGIVAFSTEGSTAQYLRKEIKDAAKRSIKQNAENIIAVKCIEKGGQQYIDVGIQTYVQSTGITEISKENKEGCIFFNRGDLSLNILPELLLPNSILQIYDIAGRIVYEGKGREKNHLPNLNDGTYLAVLDNNSRNTKISNTFIK